METILLADDETIFKAVEGTCLRRERCQLLKASADRLLEVAVVRRPDLLVASLSDDLSRNALRRICAEESLAGLPIIVLDCGAGAGRTSASPVGLARRAGAVEMISAARADLDVRLDEAIKRNLPILDRASDRVSVSVPVRCRAERASFTVRTKNVSPTGLFLKTDKPLARGKRFTISFSLPVAPAGSGETRRASAREGRSGPPEGGSPAPIRITGLCEVVRHVATASRREYDDLIPGMGVRFLEMKPAARTTLARFVRAGGAASTGRTGRPARRTHSPH